jgi:hypothetical protein
MSLSEAFVFDTEQTAAVTLVVYRLIGAGKHQSTKADSVVTFLLTM